jgi:propanol-preferring alcohol dehydrogenase
MRAWTVENVGPVSGRPLRLAEHRVPMPGSDEVLVEVEVCGVCRTDLHLVEGDLVPRRPGTVPGHQVVGHVAETGADVRSVAVGDRVGIAWLRRTCGECHWCRTGAENLCPASQYTGWDADGGFAEYAVAPAAFTYRLSSRLSAEQTAPLLCAGIIGYRALRRTRLPPGGRLGLYGFGSSAHLTAQVAQAQGAETVVMTRGSEHRRLARELGAAWVGGEGDPPPQPLDAAIVFAPAGTLVPHALAAVRRGGTVVLAGIHMTDIPRLSYQDHLFQERDLRTVASNTRRDGEELLALAARLAVRPHVTTRSFEHVDTALQDLAEGRVAGSLVITVR